MLGTARCDHAECADGGDAEHTRDCPRSRNEHGPRPRDDGVRERRVLRPVRRAGNARVAGLHVRQHGLSRRRRVVSRRCSHRGGPDTHALASPSVGRRPLRRQRGRATSHHDGDRARRLREPPRSCDPAGRGERQDAATPSMWHAARAVGSFPSHRRPGWRTTTASARTCARSPTQGSRRSSSPRSASRSRTCRAGRPSTASYGPGSARDLTAVEGTRPARPGCRVGLRGRPRPLRP